MKLADGRALAVDEHGSRDGEAVVLFHGAPGSRLFVPEPIPDGVRLVTFDRPGYGDSDPQPGRNVCDCARDVAAFADALQLDSFAVVGWSGGCPFACATAFVLGARVTRLALVSGPGPLDEVPNGWELLGDYMRPTAEMVRREPARSERAVTRHMTPYLEQPHSFLGSGRGPDAAVLHGPQRAMLDAQITAALRQGARGMAQDMVAMWLDWGFRLADVAVPTHVWHAARDPHNEADTAAYAARIPGAARTVWPDTGHLGILTHWEEVLAWATASNAMGMKPPAK